MSEAILVLAGGASQRPFVEAWRGLGLPLILADRDPRPPCRDLCDAFICASVHDAGAVLSGIEELAGDFAIRAVWTQSSGAATLTQARVSRSLGLSAFSPELAELTLDKRRFGAFLCEAGFSAPEPVPAGARAETLAYPLVVRPASTRVGKQGIAFVARAADLAAALARAEQASANGAAVATRYIRGSDWIYIGARVAGALRRIALVREHNHFLPDGLVNLGAEVDRAPAPAAVAHMESEIERLIGATGGGAGVLLASFRVADERAYWTELHLDFGGDWLWEKLLHNAFDQDVIAAVSRDLLAAAPRWLPPAASPSLLYTLSEADRSALPAVGELARDLELEVLGEPLRPGRAPHQRSGAVAIARRDRAACREAAARLDALLGRRDDGIPSLAPRLGGST